jgi:hypothetical protein
MGASIQNTLDSYIVFCSQYQTVYNAMTNKPTNSIAIAQNTMVKNLVTAGIWPLFDIFYCFAQYSNSASEALINWINPGTYNCTNISDTAWESLCGFTGDGIADYLETNYTPSTNGVNYTLDSASVGVYLRVDINADQCAIGCIGSDTSIVKINAREANSFRSLINDKTESNVTVANSTGLFVSVRTSSSNVYLYRNGSNIKTSASTSTARPNAKLAILARRYSAGGVDRYTTNQASIAFAGGLLTDGYNSTLYSEIQAYMTSNNKQV